jgi:hypothetical protein
MGACPKCNKNNKMDVGFKVQVEWGIGGLKRN